jgi:ribosome-associated protein
VCGHRFFLKKVKNTLRRVRPTFDRRSVVFSFKKLIIKPIQNPRNMADQAFSLRDGEDHIPLNTLLKLLRWVETGGEANLCIADGEVQVNGQVETQKRKKLRSGDRVEFDGHTLVVQ